MKRCAQRHQGRRGDPHQRLDKSRNTKVCVVKLLNKGGGGRRGGG